jgi:hypothetical protein
MPDSISAYKAKDIGPDLGEKPWYEGMTTDLAKIANTAERQREQPAPGLFDFSPMGGAFKTFTSHVRMRVIGFVCTSPAAEVIEMQIGSTVYRFYITAGNAPALTLFPITIDRGQDITVHAAVDHITWTFQLFYYPE